MSETKMRQSPNAGESETRPRPSESGPNPGLVSSITTLVTAAENKQAMQNLGF